MSATLTDKNIEALENGGVDDDLGIATPASIMEVPMSSSRVKQELPSLAPLKDLLKTTKSAQLMSMYTCVYMYVCVPICPDKIGIPSAIKWPSSCSTLSLLRVGQELELEVYIYICMYVCMHIYIYVYVCAALLANHTGLNG
jgi:hypothetical protein